MRLPRLFILALALIGNSVEVCALSAVTLKSEQTYRGLVIQGERPEVISCMTAATSAIKNDGSYDRIRWSKDSTDVALTNEDVQSRQLVRTVRINALARVRAYSFFDNFEKVEINCTQANQSQPRVTISARN